MAHDFHHLEEILYRPPNGEPLRSGRMIRAEVRPDHHRIAIGRRIFDADIRDVFPMPGWKREREQMAIEDAESREEDDVAAESVEAVESW